MTPDEILEQVWKLPWYKVAKIAFMDDGILFLKLWWLWLTIGIGMLIFYYIQDLRS